MITMQEDVHPKGAAPTSLGRLLHFRKRDKYSVDGLKSKVFVHPCFEELKIIEGEIQRVLVSKRDKQSVGSITIIILL